MLRPFLTIIATVAILLPAPVLAQDAPLRSMHVTGTGTVTVAPDVAILSLGVEATEKTAAEAMRGVAQDMTTLFSALDEVGITGTDRQTSGLNLSPVWTASFEGRAREVSGYTAHNMLTIRISDLTQTGAVIDALADAGANRFNSIRFDREDKREAEATARRAAAADAMAKADLYADATGVTLGDLMDLSEHSNGRPRPMAAMAMIRSADASMPVAAGELQVSITVNMRFALED